MLAALLSSHAHVELLQWLCHDDNTLNIVFDISISISIIIAGVMLM